MNKHKEIIRSLIKITEKENVLVSPEDLAVYSFDAAHNGGFPEAVVLPHTTEQVSQIVQLAARQNTPVIARGMGSGMAAASVPLEGGIVISLTRMNRILEIDKNNHTARVEAGVVTADFQAIVEKEGLFYPPDPSSIQHSTIGGNIATNAGGPRCLKYGVTGHYVLGLTAVLGDGQILTTGSKAIKDVAGYNLKALLTGSEGTLGIITEALIKLIAKPRFTRTAWVEFPSLREASVSVSALLSSGIIPATMELMDETAIVCIEEALHLGLPLDVEAILIIETDGHSEELIVTEMAMVEDICRRYGARHLEIAANEAKREDLWRARRSVSPSLIRKAPDKIGEDITVPRSQIPEAIGQIKQLGRQHDIPVVLFGHAGDGNLHVNFLYDRKNREQKEIVQRLITRTFEMAIQLGGSISGEHGIGILKRPFLPKAIGEKSITYQKKLKAVFDPFTILNPGKIFFE